MGFWRRDEDVAQAIVVELTDDLFENFIASNREAVVEVYMVGCSHCKRMAPIYERVARSYGGGARFARLDGIKHSLMPRRFDVSVTPTFLLFRDGAIVGTMKGEMDQRELESTIKIHLG
jgi:thioredoxin 1